MNTASQINVDSSNSAANDGGRHGANPFDVVREKLGRNHLASTYNSLTTQQKAMILFGAKIKASSHISCSFESMDRDEREAIRLSIIAMQDINSQFGRVLLSREQIETVKPKRVAVPVKKARCSDEEQVGFAEQLANQENVNH